MLSILLAAASEAPSLRASTMELHFPGRGHPDTATMGLRFLDSGTEILAQAQPAAAALVDSTGTQHAVRAGYSTVSQLSSALVEANATLSLGLTVAVLVCDRWEARQTPGRLDIIT